MMHSGDLDTTRRLYKLCSLSSKMAHSTIVTPRFKACSLISLSRVSSLSLPSARRCSSLWIPRSASTGVMCSNEGSHDERMSSTDEVDVALVRLGASLLYVPSMLFFRIGDTGEGGSIIFRSLGLTELTTLAELR